MHLGIVFHIQGFIIIMIAIAQIFPWIVSLIYGQGDSDAFFYSIVMNLFLGSMVYFSTKRYNKTEIHAKESFGIVSFAWIICAFVSTFPFLFHAYFIGYPATGGISTFTNAYFEMMSGFTTTGASILNDVEAIPNGLLFWRSLTHWLGGMGIILLTVAILPAIGVGGMQLYQAEVPGPISDKFMPRISQIAKVLWGVYFFLSFIEVVLLNLCGMPLFDSICHSFGTLATGGFSTKNLSIGYYNSSSIKLIITLFMFLAGINFSLHYRFLISPGNHYFKSYEFRFFIAIIIISCLLIIANQTQFEFELLNVDYLVSIVFQVVSILTTTGYGVDLDATTGNIIHFGIWSSFSQLIILSLMMIGGLAGSTSGGIKCLRIYLLFKFARNQTIRLLNPNHIKLVQIGDDIISDAVVLSTIGFILIHLFTLMVGTFILSLLEGDLIDSFSAVSAAVNNIGPGLGAFGPNNNYADASSISKWVLVCLMLIGRLEFYSIFVLFLPVTWRRF